MAIQCIDLVDTNTEDENHQREDTKRGILHDSTIVHNVSKAMKSENENEQFDMEGEVVKTELKYERGNNLEPVTVVYNRISAELEVLNVGKTENSVKIKSQNQEHQNEKGENEIGCSAKKSKRDIVNDEIHVSNIVQSKSANKNQSFKRNAS